MLCMAKEATGESQTSWPSPVVRAILAHFPCLEGRMDGDLIKRT